MADTPYHPRIPPDVRGAEIVAFPHLQLLDVAGRLQVRATAKGIARAVARLRVETARWPTPTAGQGCGPPLRLWLGGNHRAQLHPHAPGFAR